jgi:hypothetical protein
MAADTKTCVECDGSMTPILVMDRDSHSTRTPQPLAYRLPDDKRNFWTGQYATSGLVQSFMCQGCGRIAMYGTVPVTSQN